MAEYLPLFPVRMHSEVQSVAKKRNLIPNDEHFIWFVYAPPNSAENSLKRRALASQFESATVPLDDIFGTDPKKQWSEHPKFHELVQKAATYVDKLGFSSPGKGQSETMHSLARKLDVKLQAKKQPSKKILVEAIVITKLKQLDPVDAHNYQ